VRIHAHPIAGRNTTTAPQRHQLHDGTSSTTAPAPQRHGSTTAPPPPRGTSTRPAPAPHRRHHRAATRPAPAPERLHDGSTTGRLHAGTALAAILLHEALEMSVGDAVPVLRDRPGCRNERTDGRR